MGFAAARVDGCIVNMTMIHLGQAQRGATVALAGPACYELKRRPCPAVWGVSSGRAATVSVETFFPDKVTCSSHLPPGPYADPHHFILPDRSHRRNRRVHPRRPAGRRGGLHGGPPRRSSCGLSRCLRPRRPRLPGLLLPGAAERPRLHRIPAAARRAGLVRFLHAREHHRRHPALAHPAALRPGRPGDRPSRRIRRRDPAVFPHPTYTSGHPDERDLEGARRFGAGLVDRCRRIAAGDSSLVPALEPVPAEWVENAAVFTPESIDFEDPHHRQRERQVLERKQLRRE